MVLTIFPAEEHVSLCENVSKKTSVECSGTDDTPIKISENGPITVNGKKSASYTDVVRTDLVNIYRNITGQALD